MPCPPLALSFFHLQFIFGLQKGRGPFSFLSFFATETAFCLQLYREGIDEQTQTKQIVLVC